MKILQIILIYCLICSCSNRNANKATIEINKKNVNEEQLIVPQQQPSDSLKCNIIIVRKTEDKIDRLTSSEIKMFLCTFSKTCSRNVEFTEYSNEVLFRVLELYPSIFMNCINLNSNIEFEYILSELSSPLLDINGEKLKSIIQQAKGEAEIKAKIIKSIEKAME